MIKRLPKLITCAPTDHADFDHIRRQIQGSRSPFCVIDGKLYTFDDLRDERSKLRAFCDTHQIKDVSTEQWARDDALRGNFIFLLNQLLGSHLWHCGLRYNKHFKRNYFPRLDETALQFKQDWHNVRTGRAAPARTVVKFYRYGLNEFWRHTASNLSFKRINDLWFLQVIPKYFFTKDGEAPCDSDLVGPYTTGIKAREKNIALLNHVLFWADFLSQRKPVIEMKLHHSRTLVVIEKEPFSGIANFAIPNDPAIYEEDDGQLEIFAGWSDLSDGGENDEY